ncbi:MAG: sulfoxide reductase heme-binding subunit YedZ [Gemmatimonadaceae bacterium]|nr:sulfoxide reductase heme-binding subunit YedZ [Gemmatimonadaceae bacterium]
MNTTEPRAAAGGGGPAARAARAPRTDGRVARALYPIALVGVVVPAALLVWRAATGQLLGDVVKILEHETGELAMRFLAATLLVTPLRTVTGWHAIAPYRKLLGNTTFLYATLHLLVFAVVDLELQAGELWEAIVERPYITVGMLAWGIMLPLALTSPRAIARRLGGARWKALHRLTYVAAIAGTTHYLWAVKKDTLWPLLYFALFGVLLLARLPAVQRRLRRRA